MTNPNHLTRASRLTLCLLASLSLVGLAQAGELELSGTGWESGRFEGTALEDQRLTLASGAAVGTFVLALPAASREAGFNRFLPSLNAEPWPEGSSLALRVRFRVQPAGARGPVWTRWFPLGVYGRSATLPSSESAPPSQGVKLETDVITSATPLLGGEIRCVLRRGSGGAPRLRRLIVDQWQRVEKAPLPPREAHPAWGRTNPAPERAQGWLGPPLASRTCSPTSLGMVLALNGKPCTSLEVAQGVYDKAGDIYGNWCFNAAYAGSRGLRAAARHLTGWREVEDEVAAGRAVVISHRYRKGELSHPAVGATVGHLIAIVGFTKEGDPVVHDPAGNTRQNRPIRRVYKRDELWKTWQHNHEGVAYVVQPDDLVRR